MFSAILQGIKYAHTYTFSPISVGKKVDYHQICALKHITKELKISLDGYDIR